MPFEREIAQLLEQYSLEELFDVLEITPEEVLRTLLEEGLVELPPWLR